MLFGLDDGREVKSLRFLLSEMDMKTFQVEDTYLLLTEFEVRTVSYGPYQWSICGPREKNGILKFFQDIPLKKPDMMLCWEKCFADNIQGSAR